MKSQAELRRNKIENDIFMPIRGGGSLARSGPSQALLGANCEAALSFRSPKRPIIYHTGRRVDKFYSLRSQRPTLTIRQTFSPIVSLMLAVGLFLSAPALAQIPEIRIDEIANAIYKAEGGAKAQYLYGIRSVKYSTPQEARRICCNTIRNTHRRWEKAGKPKPFMVFLRDRYCPIGAKNDPMGLNSNWIKNVNFFLERGAK